MRKQDSKKTQAILVDFHCHSRYSDGNMEPAEIADSLASEGVVVASLVDHDTLDGLSEFHQALTRREIAYIPGVEITTQFRGNEVHLLAYGFDPTYPELLAALASIRQTRSFDMQSIAGSLRNKGVHSPDIPVTTAPGGQIDIYDAIALVKRAGGMTFLAHPLVLTEDFNKLEEILKELQVQGLDGIEAIYAPFTEKQRESLCAMAHQLGLLVCAGTDTHDRKGGHHSFGIDFPLVLWKAFRDGVNAGDSHLPQSVNEGSHKPRYNRRKFLFHIFLPTILAIVLFITAIFAVFLPAFERSLMERKREMIRELTNSAWSIMADLEREAAAGRLTRAQAKDMAKSRIGSLRYGRESKDYFWLQDMQPRMIMHPYRKDLDGKDVSQFHDPSGKAIFVKFADLVRQGQEGYVDYVWQWKDDPNRMAPKESYIKGFQPWGWIIGTGIYLEDVRNEIKKIEKNLVSTSLLIAVIVVLLLMYVMFEGLRLDRERAGAEEQLKDSTERYRSLVEATTEGTLLVMDGRCRYANPIFLNMLGCAQQQLDLLDLFDLFPESPDNVVAWESLNRLLLGEEVRGGFEALLRRFDGSSFECVVAASKISFAGRTGFILLIRSIGPSPDEGGLIASRDERQGRLRQVADNNRVGLFRARASSRGTIVEHNPIAMQLLSSPGAAEGAPIVLADIFPDARGYEDFLNELQQEGSAERNLQTTFHDPVNRSVSISAVMVRDERGLPRFIDGVIEDISSQVKRNAEQEILIEKLQTTLLFLHQPVSQFVKNSVFCHPETPVNALALSMTSNNSSAALMQSDNGSVIGIVTDGDVRRRVASVNGNLSQPAYRIMSSPLITISERAEIYQALLMMEQHNLKHLPVEDDGGRIVGIVHNQELMQFSNYGPIVLTREIEGAATPEEVVISCRRMPELARVLLDCGARPHLITQMISCACNAATVRLIELAEKKLGPSPVPFAFLALGSQGRQEMTLSSDQDNAIIYQMPADSADITIAESYLHDLGSFVCGWLDKAGYRLCNGDVLAQNPRWCQPVHIWKDYFKHWIFSAEPQQLVEFTIFFDFQPVYGASELSLELRSYIYELLRTRPAFFPHFAHSSLTFKPPVRMFGNPVQLNLKEALMPIIGFARLYALRQEYFALHTIDRLRELADHNVLTQESFDEISEAYEFLMRLRLQHHSALLSAGQTPDNIINSRRLGQAAHTLLNQSFAQIAAIQKRISYDFLGGTS